MFDDNQEIETAIETECTQAYAVSHRTSFGQYYVDNPDRFIVKYEAYSYITEQDETCTDIPTVIDRKTGKVIFTGIPDVDRVGMFACVKIGKKRRLQCNSIMHRYDATFPNNNRAGLSLDTDKCKFSETGEVGMLKGFAKKMRKLTKNKPQIDLKRFHALIDKWNYLIDAGMNLDKEGLPMRDSDQCLVDWMAGAIYKRYNADSKNPSASLERNLSE